MSILNTYKDNLFHKPLNKKEWTLWAIFFSLLFLYPLYRNFYPYVFSDTGTYINSGYINKVPTDRPIFYGLFVRHISLSASLWLVALGQSLTMVISLAFVQRLILGKELKSRILLLSLVITAFIMLYYSALPYLICTILPDVFTAVPLLLALILIFSDKLSKLNKIILSVLYLFFTMTHMSNTASLTLLFIIMLVIRFLFKITVIDYKKLWFVTLLTLSIYVIMPAINAMFGFGFKSTKSFHVFTMATFIDNGLLKEYLTNQEEAKQYKIYQYKDSLPQNSSEFIWGAKSVLYKTGGWDANSEEYNSIIKNIIFSQDYFFRWVNWGVFNTFKQLMMNNVGSDFLPYNDYTPPHQMVDAHYHNELIYYNQSGQNVGRLSFDFNEISNTQNKLIILSIFIIIVGFVILRLSSPIMAMALITSIFIVCNAAVTAVFSCTGDRYNSRVTWLLLFFGINLILYFIKKVYAAYLKHYSISNQ